MQSAPQSPGSQAPAAHCQEGIKRKRQTETETRNRKTTERHGPKKRKVEIKRNSGNQRVKGRGEKAEEAGWVLCAQASADRQPPALSLLAHLGS